MVARSSCSDWPIEFHCYMVMVEFANLQICVALEIPVGCTAKIWKIFSEATSGK